MMCAVCIHGCEHRRDEVEMSGWKPQHDCDTRKLKFTKETVVFGVWAEMVANLGTQRSS